MPAHEEDAAVADDDLNNYKYAILDSWSCPTATAADGASEPDQPHRGQYRRRRRQQQQQQQQQPPQQQPPSMVLKASERLASARQRVAVALVFVRSATPKLVFCAFLINAAAAAAGIESGSVRVFTLPTNAAANAGRVVHSSSHSVVFQVYEF